MPEVLEMVSEQPPDFEGLIPPRLVIVFTIQSTYVSVIDCMIHFPDYTHTHTQPRFTNISRTQLSVQLVQLVQLAILFVS